MNENVCLDGSLEEFPCREEAQKQYASLWRLFLEYRNDRDVSKQISRRLDYWQSQICKGPGPLWKSYVATLPGYTEYWRQIKKSFLEHTELALKRAVSSV